VWLIERERYFIGRKIIIKKMFGINLKRFNPLANKERKRELVAVEFSAQSIKIAYVKTFPKTPELTKVFYKDISGLSDMDIWHALRSCISELPVKNAKIISVIPSDLVISKNIEIPSVNPKEIKEIINLQAGRHTPYSREEVIVDYLEIGTYKRSYTKIILLILTRYNLKRQLEILEESGLTPERVLLAAEGISHFLPHLLTAEAHDSVLCVAHLDSVTTDFIILFKRKMLFIRSLPIGARDLKSDKEKSQLRFIAELRKSLEAYQGENIEKAPNLFICTGSTDVLKDMETDLNNALHMPVRIVSYFSALSVTPEVLRQVSLIKEVSFFDTIAPLLSQDEVKIDLIPDELKLKRSIEERGSDLIKTGIFIMTIFVLLIFILITKIYFKGLYLKELTQKFQTLHREAKDLERDSTQVAIIKNYLLSRGHSLEVIAELYTLMPLNLRLSDIRYDAQGDKFSLSGSAETMSVVFSFVDSMEKSGLFKDVKTKYTSKRKDGVNDIADFEINSSFEREVEK
jgi:Tfp pilus assembly protein PilN